MNAMNSKTSAQPAHQGFRMRLQRELMERCKRNPNYSLRSFAKALKINHATLSLILRGARPLTSKKCIQLGQALGMSPAELASHMDPVATAPIVTPEFKNLGLDTFIAISDWYHDAILELTRLKQFKGDARWIAKRLGISPSEVNIAVERLVRLELLEIQPGGKWLDRSGDNSTFVSDDFTAVAFRKLQKQLLELSARALEEVPKPLREHASMCMAIDSRDVPEAQKRMRQFRKEMCAYLQRQEAKPDQVYQLMTGFFPVTK
jgi:plasmid maintenance system antidote protein VapI